MTFSHISYQPGVLRLLDQTQLPAAEAFVELHSARDVADAIARMLVRGAPAIGIAAAYGMAVEAHRLADQGIDDPAYARGLKQAAMDLTAARPTAVNLAWATKRMLAVAEQQLASHASHASIAARLDEEARELHDEDIAACRRIGDFGAALLSEYPRANSSAQNLLTHCNTGTLATGGYGTALGIVRSTWSAGRLRHVFVDETRPLLQGARLTAWELQQEGIPYTLITDSMAAFFMQRKLVDAVIVGADRIARNGDVANKIGTYGLALAAKAHGLPFIVAAPLSTFDPAIETGASIVVEERAPHEVTSFQGAAAAPGKAIAANPAFDITPAALITAIVTELGVVRDPDQKSIASLLESGRLREGAPR